jgi:hypothetical protein
MFTTKNYHWGNYKTNDAQLIYSSKLPSRIIDELRFSIENRVHLNNTYVYKINNIDIGPYDIKTYAQRANGQVLIDIVYNANVLIFNKLQIFELYISDIQSDNTIFANTKPNEKYKNIVDLVCHIPSESKHSYKVGDKVLCVFDEIDDVCYKKYVVSFRGMLFSPEKFIRSKVYSSPFIVNVPTLTQEQLDIIAAIKEFKNQDNKHSIFDNKHQSNSIEIAANKTYQFPGRGNDYNDLFTTKMLPIEATPNDKSSEILTSILYQKLFNIQMDPKLLTVCLG